MIGLIDRERIDEALYGDFETDKAREVCAICITNLYDVYSFLSYHVNLRGHLTFPPLLE